METVVLVIHLLLALAIIGLVLLQRSEGGGLGIGGGGMGSFATAGQTANAMTRATKICAACFFATSLTLAVLAGTHHTSSDLMESLDNVPAVVDSDGETSDKEIPEAGDTPEQSGTPSAPLSE